jgi:hypothetical protein
MSQATFCGSPEERDLRAQALEAIENFAEDVGDATTNGHRT